MVLEFHAPVKIQNMPESKSSPEFRAAVGFRKWDARELVEDVIVSALKTKN